MFMVNYIASILDTFLGPKKISSKKISFDEFERNLRHINPGIVYEENRIGGYITARGATNIEECLKSLRELKKQFSGANILQEIFIPRANPEYRHYRNTISNH